MEERIPIEVEGHRLQISNLDKVMYPETGFTKAQVIDYYAKVSPVMLPHLAERPVTLKRYPDGVDGKFFFEKECPSFRPDWVATCAVASERGRGGRESVHYCVVDNLPTLVWLANLAALELHTLLARSGTLDSPDFVAFDLDPGSPADVIDCARAALRLRELLSEWGLESLPKTSGGKGLHVYVPLNSPATFERTKAFARAVALLLKKRYPDSIVAVQKKTERKGRVLVDWSQNDARKTTACAYSLRARERPWASTPLSWKELEELEERKDAGAFRFEAWEVLARTKEDGDLFSRVLELVQELPELG